jgi:glycosyltransferase involved in cell wall biosynthesis
MSFLGEDYLLLITPGNRKLPLDNVPHSLNLGYLNLEGLIQAYNRCDIFIQPSRHEGLSLSALEAMACQKPVIAFNCSSFPELVVDGKGGFLCKKEDVGDMVENIRYLAQDRQLITEMGRFNRHRTEKEFSLDRMVSDYLSLYKSVL